MILRPVRSPTAAARQARYQTHIPHPQPALPEHRLHIPVTAARQQPVVLQVIPTVRVTARVLRRQAPQVRQVEQVTAAAVEPRTRIIAGHRDTIPRLCRLPPRWQTAITWPPTEP